MNAIKSTSDHPSILDFADPQAEYERLRYALGQISDALHQDYVKPLDVALIAEKALAYD